MSHDSLQPVFQQVREHAAKTPQEIAIFAKGRSISYGDLSSRIATHAATLRHRYSIAPGDRVALLAGSHARFIYTYLAIHSIGAVCVPLDPRVTRTHLEETLARVTPRLLISRQGKPETAICSHIRYDDLDDSELDTSTASHPVGLEQPADVLFTTGTTGRSKGVVLSHRSIAAACRHINTFIGTRAGDVEVLPLPLSHSFGLGRMRSVLSAGAGLVLCGGVFDASRIVNALAKHRATGFSSVPTGIAIILEQKEAEFGRVAPHLRYLEIGSASMPLAQKQRLMELLPETRICMHYGLTEASRSAFLSFHDDSHKLESIGRPSPDVEMRVVDDDGAEVPSGSEGHLEVRGNHLMSGYWQDAAMTARSLQDGWLRTGDMGRADTDGYFWLSARSADIINVGGRKVSPQELEAVLLRHPAVAECACVGMPDPVSGEAIAAFLVAKPGQDDLPSLAELAALLRETLEPYKVPRKFEWVEELPKSSSGKVLRNRLRPAG